ncbi:MAG: hypothetical protein AAB669_00670 [Patescibacteria group bacterium]
MSSSVNSGSQDAVTYGPEDFATFLAKSKVIPLSLLTICNLPGLASAVQVELDLPAPRFRDRRQQTENQSDFGLKKSMYDRVTIGGTPIQDNGVNVLAGSMRFSALKSILGCFETAQYIETDQGNGKRQRKIELRFRGHGLTGQDGSVEIVGARRSLASIPDDHLVGFFLWVNPNQGWLRFNLVIQEWNPKVAARLPLADLELFEIDGIPTIDVEKFGFTF